MERRAPDGVVEAQHTETAPLPHAFLFWPVAIVVVMLDLVTKAIAAYSLVPERIPHRVVGEGVRLTLVYNPGAAFGIHIGGYSRLVFSVLTLAALAILWRLYQATRPGDYRRVLALALVSAGAVGNLLDRARSARGVVDFIDVGAGSWRWPTFNLADVAVTTGAVLLAIVLWREDRWADEEQPLVDAPSDTPVVEGTSPAVAGERGGVL